MKFQRFEDGSFVIIDEENKFAVGRDTEEGIEIMMICGKGALKEMIPKIIEIFEKDEILFHDVINPELPKIVDGKMILREKDGKMYITIGAKWKKKEKE